MNLLIKTNDELRRYIVNVVHEVDDEALLFDKIMPFIEQAQREVERFFIGDLPLNEEEHNAAAAIIALKAFYHAIPSLDLVLTPNGFGVVSSSNIAPASKDRVERLRCSLLEAYDSWVDNLLSVLRLNEKWRSSEMAQPFRRTLLWHLNDAKPYRNDGEPLFDAYLRVLPFAVSFEQAVEADCLGSALMTRLHNLYDIGRVEDEHKQLAVIADMLKASELRWVAAHHRDSSVPCPKHHEVWHLMQHTLFKLRDYPELFDIWHSEMGDSFSVGHEDCFPTKSGGCWI